jgi:hypothetical protein
VALDPTTSQPVRQESIHIPKARLHYHVQQHMYAKGISNYFPKGKGKVQIENTGVSSLHPSISQAGKRKKKIRGTKTPLQKKKDTRPSPQLLTTLKLLLGLSSTPTNVGSCPASKSSVELPRLSEGYPLPLPLATPLSVYGRLVPLLPATPPLLIRPSLLRSELVLLVPSCEDSRPTMAGTFSPRAWR